MSISIQALQRMPYYLQYLKKLQINGVTIIAAPAIAETLDLNEVQVRKDFASVSTTKGKPKAGFSVSELIENIEILLGYRNVSDAVLVGAGSLGRALLSYQGFDSSSMHIVAAFDINESIIGCEINGKKVLHVSELDELCSRLKIHIGIITVPAEKAQEVCDRLVSGGILAIWNFAPIHLTAPKNILIKNENMAASLALLSKHLQERING
ncbi:MAG: redox-sensing transcriptional repressor Rex [Oscillospiraceae bacterium]